jgi:hypothetical protein
LGRLALYIALALVASGAMAQAGEADVGEAGSAMFPGRGAFGVVVHTPYRAQALTDVGVQWVRIGLRWRSCEQGERGHYEWESFDRLVNYYLDHGFGVMAILTVEGICPLYAADSGDQDLVVDAIARWGGAVAQRYAGRGVVYEIGNEPEVFPMGGYWSSPVTYTRMARQVAAAVKHADPAARVAALSVAWMDRAFISTSLDQGLLADGNVDILTYHGYHRRGMMPESGLAEDVAWLRQQADRYAPAGHDIMLADSERGYAIADMLTPRHWGSWRSFTSSESEQAAYCARHYLESIYLGIEIAVWYKDMNGEESYSLYYGTDEDERGLRPMGHAYRNLAALLPDNPKLMQNRSYVISLTDPPDDISAPDGQLCVRSYLRQTEAGERLVIAAWNPVEAFDGNILDSRKRIGQHYYAAWRAASPDDKVNIPTQIRVAGLAAGTVRTIRSYDLMATTEDAAAGSPLAWGEESGAVVSPLLEIGPMPTVLIVDLK